MTVIAAVLAVSLVATVFLFLRHIAQLTAQWALHERELLTRIQHPEIVPQEQPASFPTPEPEVDDIEMVGTIQYDEEGD